MPRRRKRRRTKYYVYTVDLDPVVASRSEVRERNPDRIEDAPCVYVVCCTGRLGQSLAAGDFGSSRSKKVRKHGLKLRTELGIELDFRVKGSYSHREGALRCQDRLIRTLRKEGWTVANAPPPRNCSVYVVELRPEVAELAKVKRLNPRRDPSKKCVYVGQTSNTPEERLEQHVNGNHASRYVRDHRVRLLPCLYEKLSPMTELASLRTERNLASKLRREGYTVLGGH